MRYSEKDSEVFLSVRDSYEDTVASTFAVEDGLLKD
jgi:hypothetical protein